MCARLPVQLALLGALSAGGLSCVHAAGALHQRVYVPGLRVTAPTAPQDPLNPGNPGTPGDPVSPPAPSSAATVTLSSASLAFGQVRVGQASAVQGVLVTNSGTASLVVSSVQASGAGFSATHTCTTVAPGASCLVSVRFTPGTSGARTGELSIASNATSLVDIVQLTGTGIEPVLGLSASALALGSVTVGATSDVQSLLLSNTGSAPMVLGAIEVLDATVYQASHTCPSVLQAGSTCLVSVWAVPLVAGPAPSSLRITTDAPGSPALVPLTLTGIAPTRQVTLSPAVNGNTTWDFDTNGALTFANAGVYSVTPSFTLNVSMKAWGGGGGGSPAFTGKSPPGGGGGYASGTLTLQAGQTYVVIVGSGGAQGSTSGAAGGVGFAGGGGYGSRSGGGAGGGLSGLFSSSASQANALVIAGGGGGAAGDSSGPFVATAGGGATVANGNSVTAPTTTSAGQGASGMTGASSVTDGFGQYGSGGGGGGYWGGGANTNMFLSGTQGGTGGLGFARSGSVINPVLTRGGDVNGNGRTPANSSDADRPANAGLGGVYSSGNPGAVVLR